MSLPGRRPLAFCFSEPLDAWPDLNALLAVLVVARCECPDMVARRRGEGGAGDRRDEVGRARLG